MKTLSVVLLTTAVGFVTAAQAEPTSVRNMSLQDCLQQALEHNLDVQIEKFNPQLAQFTLRATFGAYDPELSLLGQHNYAEAGSQYLGGGFILPGSITDKDAFASGLSGLLPWGMTYSLQANASDTYGTSPTLVNDPTQPYIQTNHFVDLSTGNPVTLGTTNYLPIPARDPIASSVGSVSITFNQPLLKNFWIDSARLNIRVAKNRLKWTEWGFRQRIIDVATQVELAYYDLKAGYETVKVQQSALELAQRLLAENKKRVEVGALAPLDEKQSEAQVATSQADLISAQRNLTLLENVLKQLLTDDFARWNNVNLEPSGSLDAELQLFNLQDSWSKGLTQRPDLLQAKLDVEKAGIQLKFDRNQLYPQLDVFGSFGFNGSGSEFSGTLYDVQQRNLPFYSYGGKITIPLGNTGARNTYKADKAAREQVVLALKKLEQSIMIQIDNAVKLAQANYERVGATRKAREYAEAALAAEQKKLESGKSTSFVVLQLQKDLTAARSDEIAALVQYKRSLALVAQAEGTTLERNGVRLEIK